LLFDLLLFDLLLFDLLLFDLLLFDLLLDEYCWMNKEDEGSGLQAPLHTDERTEELGE